MAEDAPEWVHLTDDEKVLWSGHPSIRPVAPYIAFGLGLCVAGVALFAVVDPPTELFALALVPIGLWIAVRRYLERWAVQYVITSEEVYRKTGIVSRDVTQLRLDRVQNTGLSQSFLQRVFSYGDIRIDTAGTGDTELVFYDVANPDTINRILTQQLDRIADRSGLGSRSR